MHNKHRVIYYICSIHVSVVFPRQLKLKLIFLITQTSATHVVWYVYMVYTAVVAICFLNQRSTLQVWSLQRSSQSGNQKATEESQNEGVKSNKENDHL